MGVLVHPSNLPSNPRLKQAEREAGPLVLEAAAETPVNPVKDVISLDHGLAQEVEHRLQAYHCILAGLSQQKPTVATVFGRGFPTAGSSVAKDGQRTYTKQRSPRVPYSLPGSAFGSSVSSSEASEVGSSVGATIAGLLDPGLAQGIVYCCFAGLIDLNQTCILIVFIIIDGNLFASLFLEEE